MTEFSPAFSLAFQYLIGDEGTSYTDTPGDLGGPTKYGITWKSYQSFLGRTCSIDEMQGMTELEAQSFYWDVFWLRLSCDKMLIQPVAICIFDSAVLYGPSTAAFIAQKAASMVSGATLKFDGIIGDSTLTVLNLVKAEDFLVAYKNLLLARIAALCATNPNNDKFRDGWTNRANRLLTLNDAGSNNTIT